MSSPHQALFDDPDEAAAFHTYRIAQMREYGTWVAAANLYIDGVLAFVAGSPVPVSHVERFGWDTDGSVVASGTPLPDAATDRQTQLRARRAALEAERAAIEAELAESDDAVPDDDGDAVDADQGDHSGDGAGDQSATQPATGKRVRGKKSEE
jgi:hypothetical protein